MQEKILLLCAQTLLTLIYKLDSSPILSSKDPLSLCSLALTIDTDVTEDRINYCRKLMCFENISFDST